MKTIPDHMDLDAPFYKCYDAPCTSRLNSYLQRASTANTRADVDSSKASLYAVQMQCCNLIHRLSVAEDISRDNPEHSGPEVLEQDYNDLIRFISGVGVACSQAIERLYSFDMTNPTGK